MINRQIIRIKTLQLTYAYYKNGGKAPDKAEEELMMSLSKSYELYVYLLSLIVAVTRESRRRYDVACARAHRENKPEPSSRFVFNRFAIQLSANEQMSEFVETHQLTWDNDVEIVRSLLDAIEQSDDYHGYMAATDGGDYDTDRELWRRLYKNFVQDNEALAQLLEEKCIFWNDDKDIVDSFVLKTIRRFDPAAGSAQPLLPDYESTDELDFAKGLFRAILTNGPQYAQYISDATRNWEVKRQVFMDQVIMQMAIAEMLTFPSIPVSVTINEYMELAKVYSTPRSSGYINGMLDAIARMLAERGILLKPIRSMNTDNDNN